MLVQMGQIVFLPLVDLGKRALILSHKNVISSEILREIFCYFAKKQN